MIVLVKLLMTVATAFFVVGWTQRTRDLDRHRRWMTAGLLSFLGIAVVLVIGVHVLGQTYGAATWLVEGVGEVVSGRLLVAHRLVATFSGILLLVQGYSGWRRRPLHVRWGAATMTFWMISYLSGLVLFV